MCALMDEWSQIIVLDVLGRYGRMYFKKPKEGRAEGINQLRRQGRRGGGGGRGGSRGPAGTGGRVEVVTSGEAPSQDPRQDQEEGGEGGFLLRRGGRVQR